MNLVGIDGCKNGWMAAISGMQISSLDFVLYQDFRTLLDSIPDGEAYIAIDIPIGLSDDGVRECDVAARQVLGAPRSSSVFPAPCRPTLNATTYEDACARNARACGKRVSRQLFAILPKIREVDAVMTPQRQAFVREVHPEVIFATLAGSGRGLLHAKRTADGERERIGILSQFMPTFDLNAIRARFGRANVARDDIVDAVACLVTAHRIMMGSARVLPENDSPRDTRGLRMEIVA